MGALSTRSIGRLTIGLAAAVLVGCISPEPVDPGLPVMCAESAECDQASGEVCEEGVCWGAPPDVQFAGVLVPPLDRADLPAAVLPLLVIAPDGSVGGLDFPEAVAIHGRVLLACPEGREVDYACGDALSIGAQIVIERAPGFEGGPVYSRTVAAAAGVGPGEDAFSILVPRDPDAEYRITILPDDGQTDGSAPSPGQLAPPRQVTVRADTDHAVSWRIGDPAEFQAVRGCVQDVVGDGSQYAGMQVVALGRWTQLSPLQRASSRAVTDADGCFELLVPIKMLDEFDIVVKPAPGSTLPTFRLAGEFVRDPPAGETAVHTIEPPLVMPISPAPTAFKLPVEAPGENGPERVAGAEVRFTTVFDAPAQNMGRDIEITFTSQAVTSGADAGEPGIAEVTLYPGDEANRTYLVSVVPPAGSQFQSAFERVLSVGIGGAEVLEAVMLDRRAVVSGRALDASREPLGEAAVEPRASALFRLLLERDSLGAAVDQLQFPSARTDTDGSFVVWLDRTLVGEQALYDVEVTPPFYSGAPSWTFEDVEVPVEQDAIDLGDLVLPEASYARGLVRDAAGEPVPGAELHLYQLPDPDFCTRLMGSGEKCDPPAVLRGVWQSDPDGILRLVLPDP